MSRERRYALTAIEGPTNDPGLTQDAVTGISYQVDSSGTRTPLGGGGGSLPSWWTVDSTPGSESVEFAGAVKWQPSDPSAMALLGGPAQIGQINADAPGGIALDIYGFTGAGDILRLSDGEFNVVTEVGPTGAVTISPSDDPSGPTALKIIESADTDDNQPYMLDAVDRNANHVLRVDRNGAVLNLWSDTFGGFIVQDGVGDVTFRVLGGGKIGFFGGNAVLQQQLDPATCTTEDIANALIASTLMAAA